MPATIDTALELVVKHFRGAVDQDGEPYVMHCLRVMMGVSDPNAQLVALMHDLIEDTPVTIEDLKGHGFSAEVIEAIDLVTHKDQDSYAAYVVRIKQNPLAQQVKLSDLLDNSSLGRVLYREGRVPRDVRRIQRYVLSYQFLSDRIDQAAYERQMLAIEEA